MTYKKSKYLMIISLDSFNSQDFQELSSLPNFSLVLDQGSYIKRVRSIYPSLTYPCHVTLVTGTYPDKHGVYSNEFNEPGVKEPKWFWHSKYIKGATLFEKAKRSGMKVGAMFWPVMANAKVDYNIPEIWPVKKWQNQVLVSLGASTPIFALKAFLKHGKLLDGKNQPNLDNFTEKVTEDLIIDKKPNLMLIHLTDLDSTRHIYGTFSQEAKEALKRADSRLGTFINATKKAGIYEDTTFIILGDHGFLDVEYRINLNSEFRKRGFIKVDDSGALKDWLACSSSCDGSAQIYVDSNNRDLRNKVYEVLKELEGLEDCGIEKVYTKEELKKKRIEGPFEFMVEAKKGYYFSNDWDKDELLTKIDPKDMSKTKSERYVATHGYDPFKPEYTPFFMAMGPSIQKGQVIEEINLIDEAPTFAEILGLKLPNAEGRVLEELLIKEK